MTLRGYLDMKVKGSGEIMLYERTFSLAVGTGPRIFAYATMVK